MCFCGAGAKFICVFIICSLIAYIIFMLRYNVGQPNRMLSEYRTRLEETTIYTKLPTLSGGPKMLPRPPRIYTAIVIFAGFQLVINKAIPDVDHGPILGYKVNMWKIKNVTRLVPSFGKKEFSDYPKDWAEWKKEESLKVHIIADDKVMKGNEYFALILKYIGKERRGYKFTVLAISAIGEGPASEIYCLAY